LELAVSVAVSNAVLPPFMDMAVSAKNEKSRPLLVGFFKLG
jgi:hypothetical protein